MPPKNRRRRQSKGAPRPQNTEGAIRKTECEKYSVPVTHRVAATLVTPQGFGNWPAHVKDARVLLEWHPIRSAAPESRRAFLTPQGSESRDVALGPRGIQVARRGWQGVLDERTLFTFTNGTIFVWVPRADPSRPTVALVPGQSMDDDEDEAPSTARVGSGSGSK